MPIITLCASISFYQSVIKIKNQLQEGELDVLVPELALRMEENHNYDPADYLDQISANLEIRTSAIRNHFPKIERGDAVLIVNETKHGIQGYIGGNVLIEMGIAFYLQKPTFILNDPSNNTTYFDEIEAMQSIILNGDLAGIHDYFYPDP